MSIEQIVALLIAERDRLNRAIDALGGITGASGRPAASPAAAIHTRKRTRKPMSAAQKKAHSERMKAFWAARRKAK